VCVCVGFNGAGLYLSLPLSAENMLDRDTVEQTIKQVWASLWNAAGFKERAHYGLDQSKVAMALLVQPYVRQMRQSEC
jgi:phosphoenolpyruvate synthase/pyruvate phosphate dikinase